jgi:hypothetical protein
MEPGADVTSERKVSHAVVTSQEAPKTVDAKKSRYSVFKTLTAEDVRTFQGLVG